MNLSELQEEIKVLPDPLFSSWQQNQLELRKRILKTTDMKAFPHWSVIQATMYVGDAQYIHDVELPHIISSVSSNVPLLKALSIDANIISEPASIDYNDGRVLSTNLIHQAYSLSQLDLDISKLDTILEFGGGYGAMCLLCRRLGFKGHYIICDLPEFSLLQQYYLSCYNIEAKCWSYSVEQLEYAIKNVELPIPLARSINLSTRSIDLLIGLWSLSEVDNLSFRDHFLNWYPAKNYLFAYGRTWHGINNSEWFDLIQHRHKRIEWSSKKIDHLPAHYYLTGVRK